MDLSSIPRRNYHPARFGWLAITGRTPSGNARGRITGMVLAVSLLLSLAAATSVEASSPATPLTPPGTATSLVSNPYGCFSRSDLPHMSTHVPGTVDAQANTYCRYVMPRIYVRGTLYRQDCFFAVCWWTQVSQLSKTVNWASIVYVNPAYTCVGSTPTHKFQLSTYSEATGPDGITYTGSSVSQSGDLPCGGG